MARKGRATYDDLMDLPDSVVGEILGGELVVSPRPLPAHGYANGKVFRALDSTFGDDRPPGWWFLLEPELHLHGDIVVRTSRVGVANECRTSPTSPASSSRPTGSARSCRAARPVTIAARRPPSTLGADDTLVRAEPFDAVELDLSRWWLPEPAAP